MLFPLHSCLKRKSEMSKIAHRVTVPPSTRRTDVSFLYRANWQSLIPRREGVVPVTPSPRTGSSPIRGFSSPLETKIKKAPFRVHFSPAGDRIQGDCSLRSPVKPVARTSRPARRSPPLRLTEPQYGGSLLPSKLK